MRARVSKEKLEAVKRYEREHENTIKDFNFKPGDLVLVRNSMVEKSLNTKMAPRYLGPMIVIRRTKRGSYVVAELDGSVFQLKIAQFRVVPDEARHSVLLPDNIHDLIDLSKESLEELVNDGVTLEYKGKDFQFDNVKLGVGENQAELPQVEDDFEEQDLDANIPKVHQTRAVKKVSHELAIQQEKELERAWNTWQRRKKMATDETLPPSGKGTRSSSHHL
ncbi:hypothetical protein B0H19DRAFT_937853 [Mycena capillaripes]|nr:hypothetical protein B0H19DRAFT_937853 [Mycena capillaripes]